LSADGHQDIDSGSIGDIQCQSCFAYKPDSGTHDTLVAEDSRCSRKNTNACQPDYGTFDSRQQNISLEVTPTDIGNFYPFVGSVIIDFGDF